MSERGISFTELQVKGICCWQTISNINGDKYVGLKVLEKIAIYLCCDIGDLVEIKKSANQYQSIRE